MWLEEESAALSSNPLARNTKRVRIAKGRAGVFYNRKWKSKNLQTNHNISERTGKDEMRRERKRERKKTAKEWKTKKAYETKKKNVEITKESKKKERTKERKKDRKKEQKK